MQSLVEHGRFHDRIQCPMCRVDTNVASITHAYGGGTSDYDVSHVKGTFSIKIRAITAKIMDLVREDSDVKILLFSTVSWTISYKLFYITQTKPLMIKLCQALHTQLVVLGDFWNVSILLISHEKEIHRFSVSWVVTEFR